MVLESFVQALQYFTSPTLLIFMLIGVVVGLIVGIIPGLSGLVGLALILPFIFGMSVEMALPLLVAFHSVCYTGGSITAILLNIPGTPPNAATLIDGFPMAQKGEAGRAIGAALTASGLGGAVAVLFALAMIPVVLPVIFALRTADLVFIILLGLSFIGVLGGRSPIKGLISGGLGLMIAFIGFQAATGMPRFAFNSYYLYDGLPLVPLGLGLFALPEMIALATRGGAIAKTSVAIKGMGDVLKGAKDVMRHWGLWLRCSIIGYVVGIIPGVGGETATFVAYGQAKQTSKYPEKFGTGIVEGVIAPESGNNAKEAGALLTTLALGLPGSAAMALLIGAYMMLGLVPGPQLMQEHLDLTLNVLMVVAVANIIGAAICFPLASHMAKIAKIPGRVLVPLVLVIVLIGAFATRGYMLDVVVTIIFGGMGLVMRRFDYSRPAFILGFVLGGLFEKYFFMAYGLDGPTFFIRPISLTLLLIIAVFFAFKPVKRLLKDKFKGDVNKT